MFLPGKAHCLQRKSKDESSSPISISAPLLVSERAIEAFSLMQMTSMLLGAAHKCRNRRLRWGSSTAVVEK